MKIKTFSLYYQSSFLLKISLLTFLLLLTIGLHGPRPGRQMSGDFSNGPAHQLRGDFSNGPAKKKYVFQRAGPAKE